MNTNPPSADSSWLIRHEFLLRRLHSLSGLIPVGAYMVVHLMTNASVLDSAGMFQQNVYRIHSLGSLLPFVEWGFIFLPLIFHAVFGVVIVRSGMLNYGNYPTSANARYTLQRISGMIAFFFIFWHVFHMHGWFHNEFWLTNVAGPLNGAQFRPYNAATSMYVAMYGSIKTVLYVIGLLACVFHLANGIWTMGITWGVWVSPAAQTRASWVCTVFGLGLGVVGLSALVGAKSLNSPKAFNDALAVEEKMYEVEKGIYEIKAPSDPKSKNVEHDHKAWTPDELEAKRKEVFNEGTDESATEESAGIGGEVTVPTAAQTSGTP